MASTSADRITEKAVDEVAHTSQPQDKGREPDGGFKETSLPTWRFGILSLGVCLGLFLSMIDTSVVATSLYSIGLDFDELQSINWVALSYTLSYLGCAVTFARLSDIIGRRNAFVAAYIIFFAFSLACGFSKSLDQLIAFRAIQGLGGSGLYSITMIILPELCPQHLRHLIAAMIGLVIAGAGVLGPVLGGILTHYATWRWVFWINGPVGFVSLVVFFLAWPKAEYLPSIERRSWKEFDFFGSMLVIVSAVLVVFAFQNAGESKSTIPAWGRPVFIAPLVCGLVGWASLGIWEYTIDRRLLHRLAPAVPFSLLRNRIYSAGVLITLFMGFPYLLIIYAFPLRAQVVSGKSPLIAGLMLLPMVGGAAVGSVVSGKLNSSKNYLFETMLAGSCLMTIGCGLLFTVGGPADDSKALGFLPFVGLGFGLSTAGATMLASYEAPIRDYAPAQGILAQLRILGGSLGISSSTAVLNDEIRQHLLGVLGPGELATLGDGKMLLSPEQKRAVQLTYSRAFQRAMIAAVASAGVSVLLTGGLFRRKRVSVREQRQALLDAEVARRRAIALERLGPPDSA